MPTIVSSGTTQVSFNGAAATPTAVSRSQITVPVPQGAASGPVSVTTGGSTASTAAAFQVMTQGLPTLSNFSPQVADQGAAMTISGSGFDPVLANNKVFVNNRAAAVTAASATALTVTVPVVSSGHVKVETPSGNATAGAPLPVAPLPYTAAQVSGIAQGTLGSPVSVSAGAGQVGLALFDATAGQRVALQVTTSSFPGGALALYGPDGAQVEQTDLTTGSFSGGVDLAQAGTYTLAAIPGGSGSGTATINLLNVASVISAITANGTPVTPTTTVPGQNMRLTFSGTAGQRVSLQTATDSAMSAGCAILTILLPDGTTQLYQYSCADSFFSDVLALPAAGVYTIQFVPGGMATGQATFTLYNVPPDASATITPGGGTVAITIAQPGQNGKLTFSASAGQRVNLLTQLDSSLSAGCANVALVQPNGSTQLYNQTICNQSDINGPLPTPPAVSSSVPTLTVSGTYSILLNPQDTTTGTANLTPYNVPPDAKATVAVGGAAASATTTMPGQAIRVTFSGTAKQRATIKVNAANSQNNGCSEATTLRPDGKTILRGALTCGTAYSSGSLTLPVSGTYTFVFAPSGTATGTYFISVSTP